jgi:hypothetical protein
VVRWALNVSVPNKPLIFGVRISSLQWSHHLDHGCQRGRQPCLTHGDIRSFLVSIRELYRHRGEGFSHNRYNRTGHVGGVLFSLVLRA